mmetsp:Transcript_6126/g.17132  ORF Transcript_6126/g.17132 Transcript_6126/m.17132 type:complete len:369 (-) Transcript_6126:53-1159(-)
MHVPRHVVVDISAHGFGHVAQCSAAINACKDDFRLTVRSCSDEATLRERIHRPFDLIPYRQDQGMIMHDALRVDADATMDWYREFHSDYNAKKSRAATELEKLRPDVLFCDVPYLSLDAANLVGVPAVAMCSLNWADIFLSYCEDYKGSAKIHDEIVEAYNTANAFLQPAPSMPMDSLDNTRSISPIAFQGKADTEAIRSLAGIGDRERDATFILVGVGGFPIKNMPLESWPRLEGVYWIFPDGILQSHAFERSDFLCQSLFNSIPYIDLLAASCSIVVTKTGYGTQCEAVLNQVPSICIERLDWPEHEYLRRWHEDHGEVEFIDLTDVGTKRFESTVTELLARPWCKDAIKASGADEAADVLGRLLL